MNVCKQLLLSALLLPLLALSNTGCVATVAKVGLREFQGAKAYVTEIQAPPQLALAKYNRVKIERFSSLMGNKLPAGTIGLLYRACTGEVTKKDMLVTADSTEPTSPDTFIVRGKVLHYKPAGGLSSVLGKYAIMVCRIELIDSATGKIIGIANCSGFSKAITHSDKKDLARAVAKAVRKWIEQYRNEPEG